MRITLVPEARGLWKGGDRKMQLNAEGRFFRIGVELAAFLVNGFLALAFYVAEANSAHSGFAKNMFSNACEIAFLIGFVGFMLTALARSQIREFSARWILISTATLWNQTCLIAFLISLMRFRLL